MLKTEIRVGAGSPKSRTQIKQSHKPALQRPILDRYFIQ